MRRLACALALGLAACAAKPPSGPLAGKALFAQAGCVSCHRVGSEGSAVGPDLTLVGVRHSEAWLDRWLSDPQAWKPGTLMPNPRLTPAARQALVGYLSGLKGQDWPKGGRPWDSASLSKDPIARGKVIYVRAGCVNCHGQDGKGGVPNNNVPGGAIPALADAAETYSRSELLAKIRLGVASPQKADPNGPEPLVFMPAWGRVLDAGEINDVASYLLSLKKPGRSEW